ncbi:MAG: hypothetical protein IJZ94_05325 [Clostridia bacterium]|nr:hypothetical protein [Clostridia bacterium]
MADYIKRNNSDKEDTDISEVSVEENSDIQRRKNERLQRRIETEWMRRKAIITVFVVSLAVIVIIAVSVLIKNTVKKDTLSDKDENTVLVIDGETISREEFSFFCSMVLESDTFEQLAENSTDAVALSENVKSVAVKNTEEFICKVHDAANAGVSLTDAEMAEISSAIELAAESYKNKDEYCYKFYGMKYDEYFNLSKQMSLISKYMQIVSDKADISKENQQKVYSENPEGFTAVDVKMIYMDIRGLDEDKVSYKRTNAETLLHYINEGKDIGVLSEEHSDENDLFNISEHGGDNTVRLDYSIDDGFYGIFEAASKMQTGEVKVVETENEICVVSCVNKSNFEDSYNSDDLISYIRYKHTLDYFDSLSASGKYSATVNTEIYNSVDISGYVETSLSIYSQRK